MLCTIAIDYRTDRLTAELRIHRRVVYVTEPITGFTRGDQRQLIV